MPLSPPKPFQNVNQTLVSETTVENEPEEASLLVVTAEAPSRSVEASPSPSKATHSKKDKNLGVLAAKYGVTPQDSLGTHIL